LLELPHRGGCPDDLPGVVKFEHHRHALADDGRRDFDLPVVDLTPREFAVLEQRGWGERQLG
jgi:hypothetical protein